MRTIIRKKGVVFQSRMTQILNVDLRGFFKLAKHVVVLGASGTGKTSALLLLAKLFYDNGETIVWRDDSSLEFLSLMKIFRLQVFVPEGCEIHFEDPRIEYTHYDPWNLKKTVFQKLDKDRGNAIVFDLFSFNMSAFIRFWSQFFYEAYKFKRTRVKTRWAFVTDEINDLAPGTRRGYIPRQLALSSNIYFSMKKFRKEGIRLVASTHAYGDVHKPVREAFNYYLFKRMDSGSIPDRFKRYDKVIERLGINEMFIVDEAKYFNRMTIQEVVKPKKFAVKWSGDIKKESEAKHTEMEKMKKRTAIMAEVAHRLGMSYEELATMLGYKTRAGPQQFIKKRLSEEDLKTIEAILEKKEDVDNPP